MEEKVVTIRCDKCCDSGRYEHVQYSEEGLKSTTKGYCDCDKGVLMRRKDNEKANERDAKYELLNSMLDNLEALLALRREGTAFMLGLSELDFAESERVAEFLDDELQVAIEARMEAYVDLMRELRGY